MRSEEAKDLGIPLSALNPKIPRGWFKVSRGDVQEGDMRYQPDGGWLVTEQEVGLNSKFYPCIIRKLRYRTRKSHK